MKKMLIAKEIEVKVHNNREERLINILNDVIDRDIDLLKKGKSYDSLCDQIDGLLASVFYLGLVRSPISYVSHRLFHKEKEINFFDKYFASAD